MEFVDLKAQYVSYRTEIDARIADVLSHGRFIMGPEIDELEDKLAAYVGARHCLSVASGTDALEIALRALDIGPGDEVISVPFTWISTSEVIALVGAKPVWVDIDPDTFNIDSAKLEGRITPHTKAIIPVSLFGQIADLEAIRIIAKRHGDIPVIEDAAQSFGAIRNGYHSCSCAQTQIAATSFFPAKPLGCYGDGGALFTNDDCLYAKMKAIRTHGGERRHHHTLVGMNGRLDTLQAAILLAKLPHFDDEVASRTRIAIRYAELLSEIDRLEVPKLASGNTSVYAQYTIRVPNRGDLGAKLKAKGIPTAVYYPKCLHEQPVFSCLGYKWGEFPASEKASREVLSLPMHPFLSEADQDFIASAIKGALQ